MTISSDETFKSRWAVGRYGGVKALLVPGGTIDHYPGVIAALARLGVEAEVALPEPVVPAIKPGTRVVVVADLRSPRTLAVLRAAHRANRPGRRRRERVHTVLLQDGIVEWRNLFVNPQNADGFLRPAPVHEIATCGENDAVALRALGNKAIATGLPRLDAVRSLPRLGESDAVLVATANTPWFSDDEREGVIASLARVKAECRGRNVLWRISPIAAAELGVEVHRGSAMDALRSARAVVATPSTFAIEAMLAGRPTVLLHPFSGPNWLRTGWVVDVTRCASGVHTLGDEAACAAVDRTWRGVESAVHRFPARSVGEAITDALASGFDPASQRALMEVCAPATNAGFAGQFAAFVHDRARSRARPPRAPASARLVSLPDQVPVNAGLARVVNCVDVDRFGVGGVTTWAKRMSEEFESAPRGFDLRTLLITSEPFPAGRIVESFPNPAKVSVLRLDPTLGGVRVIEATERALRGMQPAVIVTNTGDVARAASARLRAGGTRVVSVMHTYDAWYRELFGIYNDWDAAVGVSRQCADWLRGRSDGRASVEMADQAPVDIAPRQPSRNGPLCIAYIGRVTQMQKRTFDLVSIASHVERLGIACAIHIVGDGEDLAALSHRVGAAGLSSVKFRFHGARSEAWVLEFLRGADILVSCSDSEGTSISMMEAMGRGVVPVVTDVSGVRDWIEDGVSGRIVRVGDTRGSAEAIAQLAHDRGMLARLARGAWESARRGGGTTRMADVYAQLWRQVLDRPAYRAPASASCVTLTDERRWPAPMRCASATEMRRCRSALARAGLSTGPRASDDVYLDGGRSGPRATPRTLRVRVPSLLAPGKPALIEAIRREIERGARRVAVFGCGRHTTRCAGLLGEFEQLVGYIDDNQEVAEFLGKPAVRTRDALTSLRPDTIVLSSDAHERALWDASAPLRIAGVRVVTLYGEYDGPARSASA